MKKDNVIKKVYGYFLPEAWRTHKGYFAVRVGKMLTVSIWPFLSIYFIPAIIAELMGEGNPERLIGLAAALVLLEFVLGIIDSTLSNVIERYGQKFENHFNMILSRRIMELDFQLTEDKKALDQLELAKNGMSWYSGGMNGLMEPFFNFLSNLITLLGVVVLLVVNAPMVLVIAAVIVAIATLVNDRLNRIEQEGYRNLAKINRIFGYLGWSLVDFRYGKDIRLYESKDMMVEKWQHFTDQWNRENVQIANKQLPYQLLREGSQIVHDVAIYFYLGALAILGEITIAICIRMINAASTFTGSLKNMVICYQEMVKKSNYANEYVKFMDYPPAMPKGKLPVKEGKHVFEFKDLSFSYPGSEVKVLQHVNLTIREGEHLSVVGLNGAGKTTLVKLMCRLYDPTEGEIRMDGINIKEYDYQEYMKVFAPVFQDFKLFAFRIKENLLLKDSEDMNPETEEVLARENLRKIGMEEKVDSFKNGMDTVLFKQFDEEGIEPSGGEQQKLAIARALIKDAPVVILDEPTAALDPIAEYEIYKNFEELVKGKTAIYISHRLSSCQFCDRIAVFSEGNVKEYGTHDELVNKHDGIYAKMFAAQAQYYVS